MFNKKMRWIQRYKTNTIISFSIESSRAWELSQELPKEWKFVSNHPRDQIIGNPFIGVMVINGNNLTFISQMELKNWNDTIIDKSWVIEIQEELINLNEMKMKCGNLYVDQIIKVS